MGTALFFLILSLLVIHVYGSHASPGNDRFSWKHYYQHHLQEIKPKFVKRDSSSIPTTTRRISPLLYLDSTDPVVYHVTDYGADPSGQKDSTDAIFRAISDALNGHGEGWLTEGIVDLGGARIDLDGGNYLISRPLRFPISRRGNLVIHGGSLTASNNFPNDGYLIDLSGSGSRSGYNFEFITMRDLFLDSNYRGGGIQILNSLRINIDNCFIAHFNTTGISVHAGHETYIRHSFLGQHITAGGDRHEKDFSGTGILLASNDNTVSNVVVFSAKTGIIVAGQANLLSGVHCYNKATGWGGVGIYLRLPGLTQTRIVDSYLDYTGIVAEDPVQLTISNCFFLGDAFVLFKSVNGVIDGVSITDNMFVGMDNGVEIVQLDGGFSKIDHITIDKNSVMGMRVKTTVARAAVEGKGTSWTADFKAALLFPNMIKHVQYTFMTDTAAFPQHVVRSVSDNRVVIQSNVEMPARVYVMVDQGASYSS